MIAQLRWKCHHVMGDGVPCEYLNWVMLNTRTPEPKALVCDRCRTPAGTEAMVRNSGT